KTYNKIPKTRIKYNLSIVYTRELFNSVANVSKSRCILLIISQMASIKNKVHIIVGAVLALIGWLVALGGIAKINRDCNDLYETVVKWCSDALSYQWWGIWFAFFLAVVILVLAILGKAQAWGSTLQALCAACLSVTMMDANIMYDYSTRGSTIDAVNAALAGFIILSIALMFLIITLGMGAAGVNVSVSVTPAPGRLETVSTQPKQGDTAAFAC
ncbi:hypothetical protein VaNZ11_013292, partial [Volvox africanus]